MHYLYNYNVSVCLKFKLKHVKLDFLAKHYISLQIIKPFHRTQMQQIALTYLRYHTCVTTSLGNRVKFPCDYHKRFFTVAAIWLSLFMPHYLVVPYVKSHYLVLYQYKIIPTASVTKYTS